MGAGQSLPSNLTHEKLFELTKNTRNVMDILLNYMLKEITVRDFLALSNPAECKKYVLFKANTLYKYFYELKIEPVRDATSREGMIAFRPVKELIAPPSPEAEKERQTLCLILAYYYTRIFQIYGALALTLIDDMETAVRSGLMTTLIDNKQRLLAPGQRIYRTYGGGDSGIPSATLGNYNFLRTFLKNEIKLDSYLTIYENESNPAEILFKRFLKTQYASLEEKTQKGIFKIGIVGFPYANLITTARKIEEPGITQIELKFLNLEYKKKGAKDTDNILTSTIPDDIILKKTLIIIPERIQLPTEKYPSVKYRIKGEEKNIPTFFYDFFEKLVPFVKALAGGDEATISRYNINSSRFISETGVIEELKLAKTIQNLTRVKPYGHCIARAIQLLKTAPFKDQPGFSSICKAKFIESTTTSSDGTKVTVSRSGIPLPGSSLDNSPGMAALAQLFYDTIQGATIKIGEKKGPDGKSTLDQYIKFMSNMATLFGDSQNRTLESYKTGLKGIINKRDIELCRTDSGRISDDIVISNNVSKKIYEYVQKLFQIQYLHAGKCGAIFKDLFNIKTDKGSNRFEISLSDNILKKGFSEIERINAQARNVLIEYYSKCEETYLLGMNVVINVARKSAKSQQASNPRPTTA
jgi:hypothetical protein